MADLMNTERICKDLEGIFKRWNEQRGFDKLSIFYMRILNDLKSNDHTLSILQKIIEINFKQKNNKVFNKCYRGSIQSNVIIGESPSLVILRALSIGLIDDSIKAVIEVSVPGRSINSIHFVHEFLAN